MITTHLIKPLEIKVWWHGATMIPVDRSDHSYHTLRRVWGDHTMSSSRGFYRTGTEDHITSSLFHQFAMFSNFCWVKRLVESIGGTVGTVIRARWAYECNELLDASLRAFHGRNFIIPDIIICFEDEHGVGVVTCEAKRPGKAVEAKDARKLESYTLLTSVRNFIRRYGCFIVSVRLREKAIR